MSVGLRGVNVAVRGSSLLVSVEVGLLRVGLLRVGEAGGAGGADDADLRVGLRRGVGLFGFTPRCISCMALNRLIISGARA